MFNEHEYTCLLSKDIDLIFENQGSVFKHYLGFFDNRYFKSPFRKDNKAGCRFSKYYDRVYLIDNATYKNKLAFNVIEFVMYKYNLSYINACYKILREVKFDEIEFNKTSNKIIEIILNEYNNGINYFNMLGIPDLYLVKHNILPIKKAQIVYEKGSKILYGDMFEFYGEELYCPGQIPKFHKKLNRSLYGKLNTSKPVIICEGYPDAIVLDYHFNKDKYFSIVGIATATTNLPKIIATLPIAYLWLDPDDAGKAGTKKLLNMYDNLVNVSDLELDIKDQFIQNPSVLEKKINKLKNND